MITNTLNTPPHDFPKTSLPEIQFGNIFLPEVVTIDLISVLHHAKYLMAKTDW